MSSQQTRCSEPPSTQSLEGLAQRAHRVLRGQVSDADIERIAEARAIVDQIDSLTNLIQPYGSTDLHRWLQRLRDQMEAVLRNDLSRSDRPTYRTHAPALRRSEWTD